MTDKQRYISKKNRNALRKKLGIFHNTQLVLHHIDSSLKHNDIERYIQWNESDVIVMTDIEHNSLHGKTRLGEKNPFYGKHHSEETKKLNSDAHKGNTYRKGSKHSDESKKLMSEHHRGGRPKGKSNLKWKLIDGKRVYFKEVDNVLTA